MKKIIGLFLVFVMSLSAFAIPVKAENVEDYPFVLVRGMEFNGLVMDYGTDAARSAIRSIDSAGIGEAMKNCIKGFIFGGNKGFAQALCDYVFYILGDMGMNPDGTSTNNVSLETYPLSVSHYPGLMASFGNENESGIMRGAIDRYGADNCYYFRYDWRVDPFYNAEGINSIIEQAKFDHNCNKVNLVCCSMGGAITVAYLDRYGAGSLNKVVFLSSTFSGTYVASDVLQGNVYIGADEVYNFAIQNLPAYKGTFDFLQKTHMLNAVTGLLNKFIEKNKELVYNRLLRDVYGTMPAIWCLVLPEDYRDCIDFMFPTEEDREKYSTVIELSERYQDMWARRDSVLAETKNNSTTFAVVATYDVPLIPVYERACTNGDGTLETALMLGGATVADYGETLYETYGDDYISKNNKYVSPDNVIDASTCIFPDYTWAFKDALHISCVYKSDMNTFLFWLVDFDGQPTINSDAKYPQFTQSSTANEIRYFE